MGIKQNLEMLYLVNELYKFKDKTIDIIFGKPIPFTTFDKRFTDQQWALKIKEYVYRLKLNHESEFEL